MLSSRNSLRTYVTFAFVCLGGAITGRNGYADSEYRHLFAGGGILSQNVGNLSNNPNGGTSLFSAVYSQVALTGMIDFGAGFGVSPVIHYTPFGYGSPDKQETNTLLTGSVRVYRRFSGLDLKLGTGVMFYIINGTGTTVTLNNGNGTTTFGTPSGTSTARMFYFTGGLGYELARFRLDLDVIATDPLSGRLALNLLSTLSFGIF